MKKQVICKKLANNASSAARYKAALRKLVARMTKTVEREVRELFSKKFAVAHFVQDDSVGAQARILMNGLTARFTNLFAKKSRDLANAVISSADKTSESALNDSLAKVSEVFTIKASAVPDEMQAATQAAVAENVSLIKSVASEYLTDATGVVMRAITSGQGASDIKRELIKHRGITERKADLIALDQTRKVYSAINRTRMRNNGLVKFQWLHSRGGQTPRPDHVVMNGNIYRFDDPPVIDKKTGARGFPGDAINCRCTMAPVLEFDDSEDEKDNDD